MKKYNLSDFKEEDINKVREFLRKALMGFVVVTIDEKLDYFMAQLKTIPFCGIDKFSIIWEVETVGNDILTALGCAIIERENNNNNI